MREDIQLYNKALDFAKEGLWREAIDLLNRAVTLRSDEAEYHSLLGVSYLGCGSKAMARPYFRQAYRINKQDPLLQPYLTFLHTGELGWGDGGFFNTNASPRQPLPSSFDGGAEASPDHGLSQTP